METVAKRNIPEITSTVDPMDLLGLLPTAKEEVPELVMTANRPSTPSPDYESVFDPTFSGELPLPPVEEVPELVMTDDRPTTPTTPTTPTAPVTTPKVTTPVKPPIKTPAAPAASSGMDLVSLLALLSIGQQPAQQAPMQDPYAHIKLMEDLFGSDIDLTPAGERTAQRK